MVTERSRWKSCSRQFFFSDTARGWTSDWWLKMAPPEIGMMMVNDFHIFFRKVETQYVSSKRRLPFGSKPTATGFSSCFLLDQVDCRLYYKDFKSMGPMGLCFGVIKTSPTCTWRAHIVVRSQDPDLVSCCRCPVGVPRHLWLPVGLQEHLWRPGVATTLRLCRCPKRVYLPLGLLLQPYALLDHGLLWLCKVSWRKQMDGCCMLHGCWWLIRDRCVLLLGVEFFRHG